MFEVEIQNKNDELFIENTFDILSIKDKVVIEVKKEADLVKIINTKNDVERECSLHKILNDSPEILIVNILGLKIQIALLENLLDFDICNPEWEVFFKINKPSSKLDNIGILFSTKKDPKESFSYDLILTRLVDVLKNKIVIKNI